MVAAGKKRRGRGFTLLEVLLVLALSFVGLFGLMSVIVAAQRAAMGARAMSEATALAQDKLEQLEHVPLATLAASVETTLGPQGTVVTGGAYTRNTFVTVNGALTTVRVQVLWNDVFQRQHQVNLYTARAL